MHVEYLEHNHAEASVLQRGARLIWRSRSCCTCEYPVWLAEIVGGDAHARSAAKPSADDEEDDQPLMHIFDEDEWQEHSYVLTCDGSFVFKALGSLETLMMMNWRLDDEPWSDETEKNLEDTKI